MAISLPVVAGSLAGSVVAADRSGLTMLLATRQVAARHYLAASMAAGAGSAIVAIGLPTLLGATFASWVAPPFTTNSGAPPLPTGFPTSRPGVVLSFAGVMMIGAAAYACIGVLIGTLVRSPFVVPAIAVVIHLVASFTLPELFSPYSNLVLDVPAATAQGVFSFWLALLVGTGLTTLTRGRGVCS